MHGSRRHANSQLTAFVEEAGYARLRAGICQAVRNAFADEGPYAEAVAALYPNMDHVLVRNGGSPLAGPLG